MSELPNYAASVPVFVDGNFYKADQSFSTDAPLSVTWIPLNAEAKAKVKARDKAEADEVKLIAGDGDLAAKLDEREAKVRAELADEISALQARAQAAEAKISAGDDDALDALAEEAKAKDAEIADLKARLKVFEPFDGDKDGNPGGSVKQTGDHGPAKK